MRLYVLCVISVPFCNWFTVSSSALAEKGKLGTAGMCSPYIHSATRPSPGALVGAVTAVALEACEGVCENTGSAEQKAKKSRARLSRTCIVGTPTTEEICFLL